MAETAKSLLVADIGGTRARFALSRGGGAPERIVERRVAAYPSALDAAEAYIAEAAEAGLSRPQRAAFAVAGPVVDGRARLTNAPWVFEVGALRDGLGLESFLLLNDFEAIAHSLPILPPAALHAIGGGTAEPGATRAAVGPGTGLGVAGLLTVDGLDMVVKSEGGHATMAAYDEAQAPILERLRARFGHVSAERVLSGEGLVNLYRSVAELAGTEAEDLEPAQVMERALAGDSAYCAEALRHFADMLAGVAGDVALAFCARGGVYIAGGIVPRMLSVLDPAGFRATFEHKGRLRDYLAEIPTWVIVEPHPALFGLVAADRQHLATGGGPG